MKTKNKSGLKNQRGSLIAVFLTLVISLSPTAFASQESGSVMTDIISDQAIASGAFSKVTPIGEDIASEKSEKVTVYAVWKNNPTACPTLYEGKGQQCSQTGQVMCGVNPAGDTLQCYPSSSLNPPSTSASVSTQQTATLSGGYIINCDAYDSLAPFCDNSGAFWCNADPSCSTKNRMTQCTASQWNAFSCGACIAGYNNCDTTNDNCEINNGASCGANTGKYNGCLTVGAGGVGNCTSTANLDCNNDDSDGSTSTCNGPNGCEISLQESCTVTATGLTGACQGCGNLGTDSGGNQCNCIAGKIKFETGTKAVYSTSDPLLWGAQLGTGWLMNFTNSNGAVFGVNNSGCIVFADGSVQCNAAGAGGNTSFNQTLTDDLYVPYSGATKSVDLNGKNLSTLGGFISAQTGDYRGTIGYYTSALGGIGGSFGDSGALDVYLAANSSIIGYYAIKSIGPVLFDGNVNVTGNTTSTQYCLAGDSCIAAWPEGNTSWNQTLTDGIYVPYIGANQNVNLGYASLTASGLVSSVNDYLAIIGNDTGKNAGYFENRLTGNRVILADDTYAIAAYGNSYFNGNLTATGDICTTEGNCLNNLPDSGNSSFNQTLTDSIYVPYIGANKTVNLNNKNLTSVNNMGIGTATPNAKLQVQDGAVLFNGTTGNTPMNGPGTRMMWIPFKGGAFRAGKVDGTQWNTTVIGDYSFAVGYNTTASGSYATAFGAETDASGNYATAMGYDTTASVSTSTAMGLQTSASNTGATAMGSNTVASAESSTAMGKQTTASGQYSTAMGYDTKAESYASVALGSHNVGGGTGGIWVSTDPIFEIGIGTVPAARANALTVLKNGNVGINTPSPKTALEVIGTVNATDVCTAAGKCLNNLTSADGTGGWTNDSTKTTTQLNVGIETTMPKATLDVNGTVYFEGGSGDIDNNGYVDGMDSASCLQRIENSSIATLEEILRGDMNGDGFLSREDCSIIMKKDSFEPETPADKIKKYGSDNNGFIVNQDVGIGTTLPKQALDVNGSINAAGDVCTTAGKCLNNMTEGGNSSFNQTLTDDIYVPYTGADQDVNLGDRSLTTAGVMSSGNGYIAMIGNDADKNAGYFENYILGGSVTLADDNYAITANGNSYFNGNVSITGDVCTAAGKCLNNLTSADGNNYTSAISVTGAATKTITLSRQGMADISASFSESDPLWSGNQSSYYNKTQVYNKAEVDAKVVPADGTGGWTNTSGKIYTSNLTDKVGIGTKSPTHPLEVVGEIRITETGAGTANAGLLELVDSNNSAEWDISNKGQNSGRRNSLDFSYSPTGEIPWTTPLTITPSGKVGIGTDQPGQELHIKSPGYAGLIIEGTNDSGIELKYAQGRTGGIFMYSDDSAEIPKSAIYGNNDNDLYIKTYKDTDILFQTNGTEKMKITSDGDVGIGTPTPSQKLEVMGNTNINGNVYVNGNIAIEDDGTYLCFGGCP